MEAQVPTTPTRPSSGFILPHGMVTLRLTVSG